MPTRLLTPTSRFGEVFVAGLGRTYTLHALVPFARSFHLRGEGADAVVCATSTWRDDAVLFAIAGAGEAAVGSRLELRVHGKDVLDVDLTWLSQCWPEPWCFFDMRDGAAAPPARSGIPVPVRAFDDVLIRSVGNTMVVLFGLEMRGVR